MTLNLPPYPSQSGLTPSSSFAQFTVQHRVPSTTDVNWPVGTIWIYPDISTSYLLASISASAGALSASWLANTGGSGAIATITGDSGGPESPSAGNFSLLGTANQITVTGGANKETFSIPSAFTAPGSITSTTTITSGTSMSSTTTMTAGTGITATTGNIVASAGNISSTAGSVSAGTTVSATTTITAGTGITSTTGNIVATAGAVNAGTSMTATAGDITATLGNIIVNGAAKQFRQHGGAATDFIGQATLVNGVATVLNTNIAAADRIFVSRTAKNGSTAYGVFQTVVTAATNFVITSCKADTTTETNDQSTVDYIIVRQV